LIGDAVNVAVRLEQHARSLGTKIVVGDDLVRQARRESGSGVCEFATLADAGPLFIGGRGDPIHIWVLQSQTTEFSQENAAASAAGIGAPLCRCDCAAESRAGCTCDLPPRGDLAHQATDKAIDAGTLAKWNGGQGARSGLRPGLISNLRRVYGVRSAVTSRA
jgi:hypothetical protein